MCIYKSISRIISRTLLGALVLMLILAASALPAAADDFGPAFFCDGQAFSNCTDTSNPALAEDTFSCEGAVRDIANCTNQITGESAPYCVFMGEDMAEGASTNRDAYLCGGSPQRFTDEVNHLFWDFLEEAQQQVGYP
jgi:hypothetical protein